MLTEEQRKAIEAAATEIEYMHADLMGRGGFSSDGKANPYAQALRELLTAHSAGAQEPVAWMQPDHLDKARVAPFLCRVEPSHRDDFVPLYTHPQPMPMTQPVYDKSVVRRLATQWGMIPGDTTADAARDVLTRWRSARTEPPKMDAPPHYSITVLGVVDDPRYHNNDDDHAFVDVVGYWPALNKWTVTHSCVRDDTAEDVEVKVTWWMPLPEAPVSRTYRLAEIERIERARGE